jgi:hypothetical protein
MVSVLVSRINPAAIAVISSRVKIAINSATPRSEPLRSVLSVIANISYWQLIPAPLAAMEQLLSETSPSKLV